MTSSPSALLASASTTARPIDYSDAGIRESESASHSEEQHQASEQLVCEAEEDQLQPQTHNTYASKEKKTMTSTASKNTTATQETKMTASAHRRLQDVLNGSIASSDEPVLPPPTSNPRRTSGSTLPPPRLLRRSSSNIRLTTSLEGKATVVLEDIPPSSPPKPPPTPAPAPTRRRPLSTPVDSKLWEFCCDNQSAIRSPASTPVQPSEATQALRLLRRRHTFSNAAGSKPIIPSLPRTQSATKFLKPTPTKHSKSSPALKRSSSLNTRKKIAPRTKKASKGFSSFEPSLDSDKENNEPGTPFSPPPEPKLQRRVLGKGSANTGKKRSPPGPLGEREKKRGRYEHRDEGCGGGNSQDTQRSFEESEFLDVGDGDGGGRLKLSSPRRIDEMECVENLLSLRGGTWR
jgi:hypothetical protein